MYDILVVNKNYDAEGPDSISVRVGDLVEVLDMGVSSAAAAAGAKWVFRNHGRGMIDYITFRPFNIASYFANPLPQEAKTRPTAERWQDGKPAR